MILPINNFNGNSKGEKLVWEKCKEYLPDGFVSFHNYYLKHNQVDLIILVPKKGVLIIEIKGYSGENVIKATDNQHIQLRSRPPINSPYRQAHRYKEIMLNDYLWKNNIQNVYVPCAVCYPSITLEEYGEKQLSKISTPDFTITKEDLETREMFLNKINSIFDAIGEDTLSKYVFDDETLELVGNLISPKFRDVETKNEVCRANGSIEKSNPLVDNDYSYFIYHKASDKFEEDKLNDIVIKWTKGIKIFFYSNDENIVKDLKEKFEKKIKEKYSRRANLFEFKGDSTLFFNCGLAPELSQSFEIINGVNSEQFIEEFEKLHTESSFNKDQYLVEHADFDDIIVKAGAGTGKTYSIISRINYIVWRKKYTPAQLKRAIAMITFTNESANAMKKKIGDNFLNLYLITRDERYLEFIEVVEEMNISTIHTMAKTVLQEFSYNLGLGKNFKITNSTYIREQFLQRNLDEFIKNNPKFVETLDMKLYFLIERLNSFLGKLDNKNIDLLNDENLDFGKAVNKNGLDFKALIEVLKKTQEQLDEENKKNNAIGLGDLIRKTKELSTSLEEQEIRVDNGVDFLFVDEFQDTDDVQIEVMTAFKEVFNFKFFVVGDIKQCIYRFRGAEVKAFDTLKKLNKSNSDKFIEFSLNKNYRTNVKLMDELNTIFKVWNENKLISYELDDVLKGVINKDKNAKIEENTYAGENEFEEKIIDLAKKYNNVSDEGNKTNNDKVAILVRYNWQIAKIKKIFDDNNLRLETDIGGDLYKIDPTIDLYKLILALKYNTSPRYLYNLYTTPYIDNDLSKVELWDKDSEELVEYFNSKITNSLPNWNKYLEDLKSEPVLKVLRDIIDDRKPWVVFANKKLATLNADADKKLYKERWENYYIQNLDQLFEKLIQATNTEYLTLNKIVNNLEIMILTKQEEESRATYNMSNFEGNIICTTVHKSKGLEFDVVVLPYCNDDISHVANKGVVDLIYQDNQIGYIIMDNQDENDKKVTCFKNDIYSNQIANESDDRKLEEARILYVALTRAIKEVMYFVDTTGEQRKAGKQQKETWETLIKGK